MQAVDQSGSSTKSVLADQFEESRYAKNGKEKQKRSKLVIAMNSVAVVVFLFASAVSLQTLLTNQQTQDVLADKVGGTTDQEGVAQGTGRDPAEEPVSDSAIINYQVAADLPRYIRIPDIDIFARVKHTGVDSEGAVDAPANIHDVSWFTESAKPGNAIGASLLPGHVQGWSGPGVFKNIDKLETGARFMVEKGSGETLTYEVTKSQEIPVDQVNMGQILSAEDPGEHDLKLMTCAGEYDAANESYLSRFVVYAKIIR
jgi:LPXTG-site transpeptidase (sortase) family protein